MSRLLSVSQYQRPGGFAIVARCAVADPAAVRAESAQQLLNVLAFAAGSPPPHMVAALARHLASEEHDQVDDVYVEIAREHLRVALAGAQQACPSPCVDGLGGAGVSRPDTAPETP